LHRDWTSVDNTLILQNYMTLQEIAPEKLWVRVPMIPGFNMGSAEMEQIRHFLQTYPPAKVEYLPYHSLGEAKMHALGGVPFNPAG